MARCGGDASPSPPVGGISEGDWRRLHGRVLPNHLPLATFKEVLVEGRLHDEYLAKDLHKIMQELRDILREHGELREAAAFPLVGRKADLGRAAAAAARLLRRLNGGDSGDPREEAALLSSSRASRALPRHSGGAADGPLPSPMVVETSPVDGERAPHPTPRTTPAKAARAPPITDHIVDTAFDPSAAAAGAAPEGGSPPRPIRTYASRINPHLSHTVAVSRSPPDEDATAPRPSAPLSPLAAPLPPMAASHAALVAEKLQGLVASSSTLQAAALPPPPLPPPAAAPTTSVGARNELAHLNERASPFFPLLSVVRRFQLRYGSHPLKFEVPVQYAQAVATRRLRVHIVPLRHPNVPARWPAAKEVAVFVNDQCVSTPWRRSWPERKEEVAKTYLPLDVTQLINRSQPQQRLQVDIFNKEYYSTALLCVVQPFSLEEVMENMLQRELGEPQAQRVAAALQRTAPNPTTATAATAAAAAPDTTRVALVDRIALNESFVGAFYRRVMDDEVEEGLEVDDPVVTTKCPISQMPIDVPVRGRDCGHLQCVDLHSYLVSCHKGAYWNCALCDRELRPASVVIDTVLWRHLLSYGSRDDRPHHLRLSPSPQAGGYYWHPSRGGSDDADVVDDSDDDSGSGSDSSDGGSDSDSDDGGPKREEEGGTSTDEEATAKAEQQAMWEGEGEGATLARGSSKRPREASPPPPPEGSSDNPIEL